MSPELVFNELSLLPVASDRHSARARVTAFLETIRYAFQNGITNRQLRTQEAFKDSLLAGEYSWWAWMNDRDVSREMRNYLKSLALKAPFLNGLAPLQDQALRCDFLYDGKKAEGLGVAFMSDSISVSLLSEAIWDQAFLSLQIQELQEDGAIQACEDFVRHASKPDHIDQHIAWIQDVKRKSIASGIELWEERGSCFPSLVFCEAVQENMRDLPKGKIASFYRGLLCLEKYCQGWQSGGFNQDVLGCNSTPDGQTAINQFAGERTVTLPNGEEKTFSYHVKLGGVWRIYYDPSPGPGKLNIGYIGRHLKTKKYGH
ncbi:MAG: hypothetical protein H7836_15115 [Magnetococcus sp. YQC-3]